MQDDRALVPVERGERVVIGGARVDDDGLVELARELELRGEDTALRVARRVVAIPVEPGFSDGDRLRMRLQAPHLVEIALRGLVGMDADDREHVVEALGERDRLRHANGEDARHACLARACDDIRGIFVERVEMRVRVDHSMPSLASSWAAVSGGSLRKSGVGSRRGRPDSSVLGAHVPTQLA